MNSFLKTGIERVVKKEGLVFMTLPVFQSSLVDHIWMLLLLQRIFSEVAVLMLSYLIVYHL